MAKKLKNKAWGGRFKTAQSKEFLEYGASIGFDKKLAPYDVIQNIAHALGLAKAKILTTAECRKIIKGLESIEKEIAQGKFRFSVEDEDVHMNIERRLKEKIGPVAGKLHTGRSRNDQVATDVRLYARETAKQIAELIGKLRGALVTQAEKNVDGIMPAYTHLQQAQPIRIAHWFLAYQEMFKRDEERFYLAAMEADVMPLGSGALAGNNFGIDRAYTAKLMGFASVTQNSIDGVSDRDFAMEFCFAVSVFFTHLSRLAEDLIIYSSSEFGAVILPDEFCTGSSIMPQKKNPDLLELFRGKAGRAVGNLVNLTVMLKGIPLAYNKDMQEDKIPLFDSAEQALSALPMAVELMKKIKFNKPLLEKRIKNGFLTAVDLADYLVMKGMPFRTAHHLVGEIVRECEGRGIPLAGLKLGDLRKHSDLFTKNVLSYLDPALSPDRKKGTGSTAKVEILKQIKRLKAELSGK
jgi:argininosuccinate lyase